MINILLLFDLAFYVKCRVTGVKSCLVLKLSVVIFFLSFDIIVTRKAPLKPVQEGVSDVAPFHYPSRTDSIKASLQFSCNFAVFNAFEGSLFSKHLYIIKVTVIYLLYFLCLWHVLKETIFFPWIICLIR
jgi:hypothetical protein